MKLLIIADDFTGALDTGVQFAKSGASTKVIVGTEVDFSCVEETVLVADTETRHLSKEEAYDIVYELSSKAEKAGVQVLAVDCQVTPESIRADQMVEVRL